MSNIPVHGILREIKHPAWLPVSVDGTAPAVAGTGAVAIGDYQPVGVGSGDFVVGPVTNNVTYKGDSGQMFTLSGYNKTKQIDDHTGDGDDAVQMRGVKFQIPGARQLSCVVPAGWHWVPELLSTVDNDADERPMTIKDTYASGKTVEQEFLIASAVHSIEAKGVLKIEADLTPYDAATETGLTA